MLETVSPCHLKWTAVSKNDINCRSSAKFFSSLPTGVSLAFLDEAALETYMQGNRKER
ncbi:MAG: hypothetical protein AAF940_11380 [Pseudomonadota bacterium]